MTMLGIRGAELNILASKSIPGTRKKGKGGTVVKEMLLYEFTKRLLCSSGSSCEAAGGSQKGFIAFVSFVVVSVGLCVIVTGNQV